MTIADLIIILLSAVYFSICLYFFIGIYRVQPRNHKNHLSVSVIISARNEADHILNCLKNLVGQSYPKDLYEVIIVDDRSVDNTAEIVEAFIQPHRNFRLLKHRPNTDKPTFKKHALNFAIQQSRGEIIMTLDADTDVQETWVEKMISGYDEKTGLVAGLVSFQPEAEKGLFHYLQTLEFAGIVFCGVGAMGNNNPIMCNGANLSYRRKAFEQVGGYEKYLDLPSGDDDLLLQEIHQAGDWDVHYCLSPEAINYTAPVDGIFKFFNQRARWASKSTRYPNSGVFLLLFSIYLFYLAILFGPILILLNLLSCKIYAAVFVVKMVPEILLLSKAVEVFKRRELLKYFWIGQFFQVPYLLIAGMLGISGKFNWKAQ